jgi:hypothetical protein
MRNSLIENGVAKVVSDSSGHYHGLGLNLEEKAAHKAATLEAFQNHGLAVENYLSVF